MPVLLSPARCGALPLRNGRLNNPRLGLAPRGHLQTAISRSYSSGTKSTISKPIATAAVEKVLSGPHVPDSDSSSPRARPLRRLSTPDVYRTMMLSHIFASPALSRLCLGALGWLANSRQPLLDPNRNRVLNKLLRIFIYNQFCAGTKPREINDAVTYVKSMGFAGVILTYAREIVAHGLAESDPTVDISAKQVEEWLDGNLTTLSCLDEGDILAIKYTGAGGAIARALTDGAEPPKQFSEALENLCTKARDQGARIMVDAEQQVYQPTIDRWTVDIMRKHNRGQADAIILNTYQAYLKGTRGVVREHLELAAREGWTFGIKLVRGAYILNEVRSLIHDTKADTDANYNSIVHDLLSRSFDGLGGEGFPRTSVFLAGHNAESIRRALATHARLSASTAPATRPSSLELGQLYGMADHVSGELVSEVERSWGPADRLGRPWAELKESGAPRVFKCINWGSVRECLHFLMRRAAENQGAADRLQDGLSVSWRELRHRWFGLRG